MGASQSSEAVQSAIYSNTKTDYITSIESDNTYRGPYVIDSSRDEANVDSNRWNWKCANCNPRRPKGLASRLPSNKKLTPKLKRDIDAKDNTIVYIKF